MVIAIVSLRNDIDSAKRDALSACNTVENVGSTLASMPHYLAGGVNELTASGIDKAVAALYDMLSLTVTGTEEIVVFGINMLTSTYLCLITLAVSSSLHAAIDVTEDVSGWLNSTVKTIGGDLGSGVQDFENSMAAFGSMVDKLGLTLPTLNLNSSIQDLETLQIPSSLYGDLTTLNNSIPTFAQVQNLTTTAIRYPFEDIKKLMNESLNGYTFNRSLLHVPAKESLTFCSDNSDIEEFFQELYTIAEEAKQIAIILLCILAILACIPMAYRDLRSWRLQRQRSRLISTSSYDNMDVVYIVSRPYTSTMGMKLASPIQSSRNQTIIRWIIAYVTTIPALFILSLGIAGLFSCLCQYLLLRAVSREVPNLVAEVVGFEDKVLYALGNSSAAWSNTTNSAILDINNKINHDLLGWVNTSTSALNTTLNVFVNETTHVLTSTFGGTPLYGPIQGVFNCLVELKIAGIEKALTWVHDKAYVDFPLLPNDTFSAGAKSAISGGGSNSTNGTSLLASAQASAGDGIDAAVSRLTQKLESGIRTEAYISLAVVGVWVVLLLIALGRAAYLMFGPHTGENGNGGNGLDFHSNASLTTVSDGMGVEMMEKQPQSQSQPPSYRGVPAGANVDPFEAEKYTAGAGSSVGSSGSTGFQPGPPPMSPTRARFAAPVAMPVPMSMPMQMPAYSHPHEQTGTGDLGTAPRDQGNMYRGIPYTLTPQPMPTTIQMPAAERESLGYAGKRSVDLQKPKVLRVSSYGNLE